MRASRLMGALLVAALAIAPLWATGELAAWGFEEPPSRLRFDEGQRLPGHGPAPSVAAPAGHAALWDWMVGPAILVCAVALVARRSSMRLRRA